MYTRLYGAVIVAKENCMRFQFDKISLLVAFGKQLVLAVLDVWVILYTNTLNFKCPRFVFISEGELVEIGQAWSFLDGS